MTKFGGKIIKYFEMVCFIKTSEELQKDTHNLGLKLSARIGEDESIYRNIIKKYYSLDFSHFNLRNKGKILENFDSLIEGVTPGLNYDNEIDSIDNLLPREIFDWTSNIGSSTNISSDYKISLNYNDELLYDKLKRLFFYFNNEEDESYNLPIYNDDSNYFDAANILVSIIKSDYSEVIKLLENLSKFSNFDVFNALHHNSGELLRKMLDSEKI